MQRIFGVRSGLDPRFFLGTLAEVEELFGGRIPELPDGPLGQVGDEAFLVELYPPIRKSFRELLEHCYWGLTGAGGEQSAFSQGKQHGPLDQFEAVLETVLASIIEQERRLGLMNLFWLAHSRVVADQLQEFFAQPNVRLDLKYQLHPFLQGVHRNALERVWTRYRHERGNVLRRNLGAGFTTALIDSIVDDQLAFTEPSIARLNFSQVLVENNKRFRLTFREFREIHTLFRERLRELLRRRDPRVMEMLRRWLPGVRPEAYEEERTIVRLLFNSHMVTYLLAELGGGGGESSVAKLERAIRRGWADLVLDYLDLMQAVKRSEVVWLARQAVGVVGIDQAESELRVRYDEGRLFRFYPDGEIWKLARKITVLFADVRGFTATSEGGVSERELAQHLYEIFDPFAPLVERFQGRIDKFTGDGAMITFGFSRVTPDDELNALRTALAVQDLMAEMRAGGRTRFTIGISVHTGRAQVAHFILDDRGMDRTVIGRSVNIAGRLSGSGKVQEGGGGEAAESRAEEGARGARSAPPRGRREVWIDDSGTLYNAGIVVSQDTVEELARRGIAEPFAGGGIHGFRYHDPVLGKNVLLEYVGDAKFKGVGRSVAIYRLGATADGPSRTGHRPQERA